MHPARTLARTPTIATVHRPTIPPTLGRVCECEPLVTFASRSRFAFLIARNSAFEMSSADTMPGGINCGPSFGLSPRSRARSASASTPCFRAECRSVAVSPPRMLRPRRSSSESSAAAELVETEPQALHTDKTRHTNLDRSTRLRRVVRFGSGSCSSDPRYSTQSAFRIHSVQRHAGHDRIRQHPPSVASVIARTYRGRGGTRASRASPSSRTHRGWEGHPRAAFLLHGARRGLELDAHTTIEGAGKVIEHQRMRAFSLAFVR